MKKNVFKAALLLCSIFLFGNSNLQNYTREKAVSENVVNSTFIYKENLLNAGIIPPRKPVEPKKLVPETSEVDLQILKV